jgi:hypothetical protein
MFDSNIVVNIFLSFDLFLSRSLSSFPSLILDLDLTTLPLPCRSAAAARRPGACKPAWALGGSPGACRPEHVRTGRCARPEPTAWHAWRAEPRLSCMCAGPGGRTAASAAESSAIGGRTGPVVVAVCSSF